MSVLVTGAAGFIGYHVCAKLLERGEHVIGVDNLNDYYDVSLKESRLELLNSNKNFLFYPLDLSDINEFSETVRAHKEIDRVVHLAAQAGVRYSTEAPFTYVASNLVGHVAVLEACRNMDNLKHLVYASSSSVYGGNTKLPFSVEDQVNTPRSLYAATKRADELMTYTYSHLYGIPATGLRFFTVYGPWGRPDMATYLFTKAILEDKPITVFNNGDMKRDFTYIGDIVNGTIAALDTPPTATPPHKIYNLGNHKSEDLMHFIAVLEKALGKKARTDFRPMHPGDVKETYADISQSQADLGFAPSTPIEEGLPKFVQWYKEYYKV